MDTKLKGKAIPPMIEIPSLYWDSIGINRVARDRDRTQIAISFAAPVLCG
jgi:hypothetical protein